ncbi:MAG: HAD hydrolase-like protein [Solobacterium sp.]|nr:HAD hydrolase-like protein [Solobacterium sp.]
MLKGYYLIELETLIRHGRIREGAIAFLESLQEEGFPYLIITEQSARSNEQIASAMMQSGFSHVTYDQIYTGVMAAVDWMIMYEPQRSRAAYIGSAALRATLERGGYIIDHRSPELLFTGLNRNMTYQEYSEALGYIMQGAILISTDGRMRIRSEGVDQIGNGAIVKMLEAASGETAEMFGRGSEKMMRMALRYMQAPAHQVIMVGSDFERDIVPALLMNMSTVFVTEGNSIEDLGMSDQVHPDYIVETLYGLTK